MSNFDFLTIPEVARELGVPEATVRYWRWSGTDPQFAKLGRRVLIRRSDLDHWVDTVFASGCEQDHTAVS